MSLTPSEPEMPVTAHLYALSPPPRVSLESIDARLTMLADHVMATQALVRSATWPSRLPLWAIACGLYMIAGTLLAMLILKV